MCWAASPHGVLLLCSRVMERSGPVTQNYKSNLTYARLEDAVLNRSEGSVATR